MVAPRPRERASTNARLLRAWRASRSGTSGDAFNLWDRGATQRVVAAPRRRHLGIETRCSTGRRVRRRPRRVVRRRADPRTPTPRGLRRCGDVDVEPARVPPQGERVLFGDTNWRATSARARPPMPPRRAKHFRLRASRGMRDTQRLACSAARAHYTRDQRVSPPTEAAASLHRACTPPRFASLAMRPLDRRAAHPRERLRSARDAALGRDAAARVARAARPKARDSGVRRPARGRTRRVRAAEREVPPGERAHEGEERRQRLSTPPSSPRSRCARASPVEGWRPQSST